MNAQVSETASTSVGGRGYSERPWPCGLTYGQSTALIPSLRQTISTTDKELPLSDVQTLRQRSITALRNAGSTRFLLSIFAGLGILFALVGVYSLISYIVSSQTRNIGIRSALGARPQHILAALIFQTLHVSG